MARDFATDESVKNEGILDVFPAFETARMEKKIRCPAADDLFRDSLEPSSLTSVYHIPILHTNLG